MYKEDLKRNRNNTKGLLFILFFRISAFFGKNILLKIIGFPIRLFYKVVIEWFLGIEIPNNTKIGKGFKVMHGQGLVINPNTIIGDNVTIRHNTTVGNSISGGKSPVFENNIDVGANSVIIGNITIGHDSIIGAGSVVVKDVQPYSVVVGNPAKVIKTIEVK